VPHWQDIESAAEFEALRLGREPQPELNQVGQALVSLALEMVLGRPKSVIAELIHQLSDIASRPKYLGEPIIRIAAIVCWRAFTADVVQFDLANVEYMEPFDHFAT
jgi:hypothetical protein